MSIDVDSRKKMIKYVLKRIPKNSKCPCGSGKKYKICHMNKDKVSMHQGVNPTWFSIFSKLEETEEPVIDEVLHES